jgi:hypothetical protein
MIASTDHLLLYTDTRRSDCLSEQTRHNVARYASASPLLLDQRLQELSREWWAERICTAALAGAVLAAMVPVVVFGNSWLVVPGVFAAMLLSQAVFAWSPIMPLIRLMGYRTACEIWNERYALKALRGDFQRLDTVTTPQDREDLSRFEGEGGPAHPDPNPDASDAEIVNEAIRAVRS